MVGKLLRTKSLLAIVLSLMCLSTYQLLAGSVGAYVLPESMLTGPQKEIRVGKCGFWTECPRNYEVSGNLFSEPRRLPSDWAAKFQEAHNAARFQCAHKHKTSSGGYCYNLNTSNMLVVPKGEQADVDYAIPAGYEKAGTPFVDWISQLLDCKGPTCRHSISDFGAGVGQVGHALKARHANIKYQGYDAAGNVEEFTNNFIRFFDLSIPFKKIRTNWVMSIEVGEHVSHEQEAMVISNLHAHNCQGIFLAWARLAQGGDGHINNHSEEYLIKLFEELGYILDRSLTHAIRTLSSFGTRSFLAHNALVFNRSSPMSGCDEER